ncbi:hypothetical protein MTO96_024676 [Rhipicephalus appendiculatus]
MAQPVAGLETAAEEAGGSGAVAFPPETANSAGDLGGALKRSHGTTCLSEDEEFKRFKNFMFTYVPDPLLIQRIARMVAEPAYHPSDFRATRRALIKVAREKNLSNVKLIKDIVRMVILFVACGSNLSKMEERISTQELAMLKRLEKRYNLQKKATPVDVLTLSRVAMTFYYPTIYATVRLRDRLPVSPEEMCLKSADYPVAMMTEAFLFLIPKGFDWEREYVHAHYLFLGEFTRMIKPDLRNAQPSTVQDAFKYAARAALESRDSRDYARKVSLLKTLGLTTAEGAPSPAVLAAARVYRSLYEDVEPGKEEVQGTTGQAAM